VPGLVLRREFAFPIRWIRALCSSPHAGFLACVESGNKDEHDCVTFWRVKEGPKRRGRIALQSSTRSLSMAADESLIAFGALSNRYNCVCDPRNCSELTTLRAWSGALESIVFVGSSHILASGGVDGVVRLWDCDTGAMIGELKGPDVYCLSMASSSDGTMLAVGGMYGSVCLWDVVRRRQLKMWRAHVDAPVIMLAFSADGTRLASGCDDIGINDARGHSEVRVWTIRR
jgi:WD40 repeat protein